MGRPKKGPKELLVEIPCKVPPADAEEIERISLRTDRSKSQVARKLIARGLAAYRRDAKLDEGELMIGVIVELPDSPNTPNIEDSLNALEAEVKAKINKTRFDIQAAPAHMPESEDIEIDDNFEFNGEESKYVNAEGHVIDKKTGKRIRDLRVEKDYRPKPSYPPPGWPLVKKGEDE